MLSNLGHWLRPDIAVGALVAVATLCGGLLVLRGGPARGRGAERVGRIAGRAGIPAEAAEPLDPFVCGSTGEKRIAARRSGNPVAVFLTDAERKSAAIDAVVVERSLGGLAVQVGQEFPEGAVLSVRAEAASTTVPWVQVEVRSCRRQGAGHVLGCSFLKAPPTAVYWSLG